MKLPKQVQEAEERANKAIEGATKPPAAPPEPQPSDPPVEPVQPSDPPSADPAPPEKPEGQPREDWKAKYHTLQGMFNAEVPRLHRDLKAANARIDELNAALEKASKAPTPNPQPTEPTKFRLPTSARETLGQDVADAIEKLVEGSATGVRDDLGKEIAPIRQDAEAAKKTAEAEATERATASRNAFLAALTTRVPDWQAIDQDERWHAFLAERDRFARRPRQELIAEAFRDGDVDAVAGFFEAFKDAAEIGKKPVQPPPADNPLTRQQVPDTSGRSSVVQDKKVWTREEIADTYKQIALGKIPADKAAALENDIVAAGREGRIR